MGAPEDFDADVHASNGLDPYGERLLDDQSANSLAALVAGTPRPPEPPSSPLAKLPEVRYDPSSVVPTPSTAQPSRATPFTVSAPSPLFRSVPNDTEVAAKDHLARQGPLFDPDAEARRDPQATTAMAVAAEPQPDRAAPEGLRWSTVVHEPAAAGVATPREPAPVSRSFLGGEPGSAPPPMMPAAMPIHEDRLVDSLAGLAAQRWFWSVAVVAGALAAMLVGFGAVRYFAADSNGSSGPAGPIDAGQDGGVAETVPQGPALSDTGSGLPGSPGDPATSPPGSLVVSSTTGVSVSAPTSLVTTTRPATTSATVATTSTAGSSTTAATTPTSSVPTSASTTTVVSTTSSVAPTTPTSSATTAPTSATTEPITTTDTTLTTTTTDSTGTTPSSDTSVATSGSTTDTSGLG